MTHTTVIKKLIGQVAPVGETNADNEAYENLRQQCIVINELLEDVERIAKNCKDRKEFSIKRAGEFAQEFIDSIKQRD